MFAPKWAAFWGGSGLFLCLEIFTHLRTKITHFPGAQIPWYDWRLAIFAQKVKWVSGGSFFN
jgi:hypothetical protein